MEAQEHSVPITMFLLPLFRPLTSSLMPPGHLGLSVPVSVFLVGIHFVLVSCVTSLNAVVTATCTIAVRLLLIDL